MVSTRSIKLHTPVMILFRIGRQSRRITCSNGLLETTGSILNWETNSLKAKISVNGWKSNGQATLYFGEVKLPQSSWHASYIRSWVMNSKVKFARWALKRDMTLTSSKTSLTQVSITLKLSMKSFKCLALALRVTIMTTVALTIWTCGLKIIRQLIKRQKLLTTSLFGVRRTAGQIISINRMKSNWKNLAARIKVSFSLFKQIFWS